MAQTVPHTRLSTIEVSTANTDCPHQRLTHQLLHGSALLSRPLNAEARQRREHLSSSHLATPRAWPPPPADNEVMFGRA